MSDERKSIQEPSAPQRYNEERKGQDLVDPRQASPERPAPPPGPRRSPGQSLAKPAEVARRVTPDGWGSALVFLLFVAPGIVFDLLEVLRAGAHESAFREASRVALSSLVFSGGRW